MIIKQLHTVGLSQCPQALAESPGSQGLGVFQGREVTSSAWVHSQTAAAASGLGARILLLSQMETKARVVLLWDSPKLL